MKVCPVCNETFADDMKFCDLDGTRLARQAESTGAPAHHSRWSWLGVALLIGALALSAISIFMIPRSRGLQSPYSSSSSPSVASSKPSDSNGTSNTTSGMSSATSDQPEIIIASDAPPADPTAKKKEKTKPAADDPNAPKLDPKAAAQTGDDSAKTETAVPAPPPAPKHVDPTPAPKPVNETPAPAPAPKPVAAPPAQRDQKHQAEKDDKKRDDKKKSGGFFHAFKKIFGGKD